MTDCKKYIIDYAKKIPSFTSKDLIKDAKANGYVATTVNWTLRQLTIEGMFFRIGRGLYSTKERHLFKENPDDDLKEIAGEIMNNYPEARICVYKGTILSPLLHHLSYNV